MRGALKNKMTLGLAGLCCCFLSWVPVLFAPTLAMANANNHQLSENWSMISNIGEECAIY